jgi:hypothetical protein
MKTCFFLFLLSFCSFPMVFSQNLNIELDPDNFSCGLTSVTASTGCNSNGFVDVELVGMPPGVLISNISDMTDGNFTFDIDISYEAPEMTTLRFEALSSDDPTGCILPGFEGMVDIQISCVCDLLISISTVNETCFGCNDGSAVAEVSGGDGNYMYEWSDGSFGDSTEDLSPGDYLLVVTDGNACSAEEAFSISAYICPGYSIEAEITEPQCNGDCNGSIFVTLSNGSNSFEVMWSDNSSGAMRIDLCAGNYMLTVVDSDNCSMTSDFTISQPDPLTANVVEVIPAMNGQNGSIILAYAGPEPLEAAYIKFEGIKGEINPANNEILFNGLAPECYDIVLEDVTGCTVELDSICVDNISSVRENILTDINLYPNPAQDFLQIRHNEELMNGHIEIFSTNGVRVLVQKDINYIDISMLPGGLYFILLQSEQGVYKGKFSKI